MKKIITIHDINNWSKHLDGILWNLEKLEKGMKVILNMEYIKFIRPQGAIMLTLLCKIIFEITEIRVELVSVNTDVYLYIERLDLLKCNFVYLNKKPWIWKLFNRSEVSFTILEITHIKTPQDTANLKFRIKQILNTWYPERTLTEYSNKVSKMVEEICNNSLEHSTGKPGVFGECYCTLQKYVSSGKPVVVIALGDTGIGIKNHLNLQHKWLQGTDAAYIKHVLKGFSGRADGSGGMGIPFIKNTIASYNGSFHIRSGKSIVECKDTITSREFRNAFPGTQSILILN